MASTLAQIEVKVRQRLIEPTAKFWSSTELLGIITEGFKDLWRDIVELKQEHYLTVNTTDVTFAISSDTLSGVPNDVHKIYMVAAVNNSADGTNEGLIFLPRDFNSKDFQAAKASPALEPKNNVIYYAPTGQGAPVAAPVIYCAPRTTSAIAVSFAYIPTLGIYDADDYVPIPGEADNALVSWTVAFARAKEREDRSPDPAWLQVYMTEKAHLLESLGVRQYQEPLYVDAIFEQYWG